MTSKNFRCFDPKAAKFSVFFMRNGSVEVIIRAISQSIKNDIFVKLEKSAEPAKNSHLAC